MTETRQVPIYDTITYPAVYGDPIQHPAEYDTIHHDIEIGVTHYPEEGHWEHHNAQTHWEHVDGYYVTEWVDDYDWVCDYWCEWVEDYDYGGSWDCWTTDCWEELVGGHEEIVGYVDGYDYEVTDQEASDEWVVDSPAHDDYYIISPAYNEYVLVREAWTEPGPLISPARTETIITGYTPVTFVVQEGYWGTEPVPGYWGSEEVPGYWDYIINPAHYITQTIAASTLGVNHDGQTITGLNWSLGRPLSVPDFVSDFLNNPDWSLDEPEEGGDIDISEFTPALAFEYSGTLEEELKKLQEERKHLRKIPSRGGWVIERVDGPMSAEEAMKNIAILILIAGEQLTRTRPDRIMVFITYEKLSMDERFPRKVYTGRTSGWGTAVDVLNRRDSKHDVTRPSFWPAVPNSIIITKGYSHAAWMATRGREQSIMDYHDLIDQTGAYTYDRSHSENARPTPTRPFGTRGVARNNSNAANYHQKAIDALTWIWNFTGDDPRLTADYFRFPWPPENLLFQPIFRPPLAY